MCRSLCISNHKISRVKEFDYFREDNICPLIKNKKIVQQACEIKSVTQVGGILCGFQSAEVEQVERPDGVGRLPRSHNFLKLHLAGELTRTVLLSPFVFLLRHSIPVFEMVQAGGGSKELSSRIRGAL